MRRGGARRHRDSPGASLGRVEHGLLAQDRLLDRPQARSRFEAQLLDVVAPRFPIRLQRLSLAAGAVEGEHELAAQPFAERVLGDESLQLRDQRRASADAELRLDALLERGEPQLLEAFDLHPRERFEGEVAERPAAPQRQRLVQLVQGTFRRVGRKRTPALLEQSLVPVEIDVLEAGTEHVAGRARDEDGLAGPVCVKRLAQPRHVRLYAVRGAGGRLVAPQLVDQDVPGHDLVGAQQEDGQ
jgi:hypothetical protein